MVRADLGEVELADEVLREVSSLGGRPGLRPRADDVTERTPEDAPAEAVEGGKVWDLGEAVASAAGGHFAQGHDHVSPRVNSWPQ
jgi:hypothetical protein